MPKVLAISSQVTCGHVGLSAIVPALQALQQQIIALPTILLSNHPGHPHVSGSRIEPSLLKSMLDALESNGWLRDVTTVMTGYCPTTEHVQFANHAVGVVKRHAPGATIICDPVIGDEPEGVYIDQAAARAIRDELIPHADILLPNAFELGWLHGKSLSSLEDIKSAARHLPVKEVVVTSVPWPENRLANLHVSHDNARAAVSELRVGVPKGTGDFLSGVFAHDRDIGLATGRTEILIESSLHQDHLNIAEAAPLWLAASASNTIAV